MKILTSLTLLAFLTPQEISRYHFVSDMILNLKISRNSPPLAIIEDENLPYLKVDLGSSDSSSVVLKPQKNLLKLLEIAKSFKTRSQVIPHFQRTEARMLSGLKLDKNSPNVALIKKYLGSTPQVETQMKFSGTDVLKTTTTKVLDRAEVLNVSQEIKSALSSQQQARVDAMDGFESTVQEIHMALTPDDSFDEYAEQVIAQNTEKEMPQRNIRNIAQTLPAQTSPSKEQDVETTEKILFTFPSWLVGAPQPQQTVAPTAASTTSTSRLIPSRLASSLKAKASPALASLESKPTSPQMQMFASRALALKNKQDLPREQSLYSKSPSQVFISGNLEMSGGLALTGQEKIKIYHQVGGSIVSYGNVILEKGRYEIFIENPKSGMLVAELGRDEQLLGKAEILLPDLLMKTQNTGELKSVLLQMKPVYDKVNAITQSAYNDGSVLVADKIVINDVLPLKKKSNSYTGTVVESTLISKADKAGYWGSLVYGTSKQEFRHTLFADSTIRALYGITEKKYSKTTDGTVYGTVKISGKPIARATVEIVNSEGAQAIYFNTFLPDKKLLATEVAGTFSFVGLEPGTYILRAKYQDKYLSSQVITVESGYISQVEFDVQEPHLAEAFVYDLRSSQMQPAEIGFLGSDKYVKSKTGRQLISLSGSEGIQIVEAQASDAGYYTTRMTLDKSQKEILLPLIHQDWMNELMSRSKFNILPGMGTALGLTERTAFYIEMDPQAYNEETKIIYFDDKGQTLTGAPAAPVGGGVFIVNMNPGLRSVFVKYQNSQATKVISMAVDASAVNVFSSPF